MSLIEAFLYGVASTLMVEAIIQTYLKHRYDRREREIRRLADEIIAAREVNRAN